MKVLIADDHPMVRDALARTLQLIDPVIQVMEAADYVDIERALALELPRLALVDLNMPGMNGLSGLRRLRERYPSLKLVVASGEEDPAIIRGILGLGVSGYLPKSEPAEVLRRALQLILAGSTYLPQQALGDYRNGQPPARPADTSGLTARQLDVLRLLMRGNPNKLIARELVLTEGTVKIHIAAILRALQARNRTEAVITARKIGIGE